MPKHDFFRINMPYGLQLQTDGNWIVFNRNYAPLGHISKRGPLLDLINPSAFQSLPITAKYSLSEERIRSLTDEHLMRRNQESKVDCFWLYEDRSFPMLTDEDWQRYSSKLKVLAETEIL